MKRPLPVAEMVVRDLKAENARLREERAEMVRQFEADEAAAERDHAELAKLREDRDNWMGVAQNNAREIARLREKVVLAQNVALAWGDGNNDALQVALLSLFLNLYGQAPRNALKETDDPVAR